MKIWMLLLGLYLLIISGCGRCRQHCTQSPPVDVETSVVPADAPKKAIIIFDDVPIHECYIDKDGKKVCK